MPLNNILDFPSRKPRIHVYDVSYIPNIKNLYCFPFIVVQTNLINSSIMEISEKQIIILTPIKITCLITSKLAKIVDTLLIFKKSILCLMNL